MEEGGRGEGKRDDVIPDKRIYTDIYQFASGCQKRELVRGRREGEWGWGGGVRVGRGEGERRVYLKPSAMELVYSSLFDSLSGIWK